MPRAEKLMSVNEHTTSAPAVDHTKDHTVASQQQAISAKQAAEEARRERTRKNQKRCRQKRKEHTEALQEQIRQLQGMKMEATIDMQRAAREVSNENAEWRREYARQEEEIRQLREEIKLGDEARRSREEETRHLRALLNRHGISDDGVLVPPVSGATVRSRNLLPDPIPPAQPSAAFKHLEQLLQPRQPKCRDVSPDSSCCSSSQSVPSGASSRPTDPAPSLKHQNTPHHPASPIWHIPPPQALPAPMAAHEDTYRSTQYHPVLNPGTVISRTDAALALRELGSAKPESRSPTTSNMMSATLPGVLMPQQSAFDYDMPLFSPAGYNPPYSHRQRLSLPSSSSSSPSNYMQGPRTENNCSMATQFISNMIGLDPQQVRGELGCLPGMDCHVDNETFSNFVSRYTMATTVQM
ncbi:hypothetical protein GE09DRAFT_672778 [Coniochaeta sp. 2T2.1]|nr:hypothetical protein GE09DRAFT_672778 [Coniochaeta sp. 2T2.1]